MYGSVLINALPSGGKMLSFDDAGEMLSFMLVVTQLHMHMYCARFFVIEAACPAGEQTYCTTFFVSEEREIHKFKFTFILRFYHK